MVAFSETEPDDPIERLPTDPSEEEIARRSELIRRNWSKSQVRRRRVNRQGQDGWRPPAIDVNDLNIE